LLLASVTLTGGCRKEEAPPPDEAAPSGSVKLSFRHMVDAEPLVLGGPYRYTNAAGDSFLVNLYKYYISNIRLTDANGNSWAEPESYHLVDDASTASLSFTLSEVPPGTYTSMQFMIGVDSARNCSGVQSGALDPLNGMFWTWNSGYIMAKFEGKSPSSTMPGNLVLFHIGGFGGDNATQRTVSPSFGASALVVSDNTTSEIRIDCNVNEWFRTPGIIDFSDMFSEVDPGYEASLLADNYADMFTITAIIN
ncbi:MAG TPA: MbnP family protein, partial [Bacteroidia bacterium]|nr:MbnP family protein [Bacteroidia bacterium]